MKNFYKMGTRVAAWDSDWKQHRNTHVIPQTGFRQISLTPIRGPITGPERSLSVAGMSTVQVLGESLHTCPILVRSARCTCL